MLKKQRFGVVRILPKIKQRTHVLRRRRANTDRIEKRFYGAETFATLLFTFIFMWIPFHFYREIHKSTVENQDA